jgi:hypothetical protein
MSNLIRLNDEYYLIGSIREDAKIRYWHTDQIGKPWRSYHDNVLMAKGNYAGRVCRDDRGWLLWNTMADQTFHHGLLGVYLETAHLELSDVRLNRLHPPYQSDEHLVTG